MLDSGTIQGGRADGLELQASPCGEWGLFQLRDNGLNALHERQGALRSRGEPAKSGRLPGNGCGVLVTMPPNSTDVKELLLNGGVAENAAPGTLSIDMTSGAPGGCGEICAALKKRGIRFVDAPVSGGEPMAVEGTLAIMTGGEREDFERARAAFDAVSRSATWGGSVGSGNACKPVNQIIVALNIAALSEGLMPVKKGGADTQPVFEAIRGGLAGSAVMNDTHDPGGQFQARLQDRPAYQGPDQRHEHRGPGGRSAAPDRRDPGDHEAALRGGRRPVRPQRHCQALRGAGRAEIF